MQELLEEAAVPEAAEFSAVAARLGGDARWAALAGDEERRRALGRHGARLRAEAAFARLLDETPGLAADTPWPLVKRKARGRPRADMRPVWSRRAHDWVITSSWVYVVVVLWCFIVNMVVFLPTP